MVWVAPSRRDTRSANAAARHRVGAGDAQARVDAGHQPELVDVPPHRPVRQVLDEDAAAHVRPAAGRGEDPPHGLAHLPLWAVISQARTYMEGRAGS